MGNLSFCWKKKLEYKEHMKFTGLLLEESLTDISVLSLVTIVKIEKWDADNASSLQPKVWTAIRFEGEESKLSDFVDKLSKSLKPKAWYITIKFGDKEYVVFPNKIFSYVVGDKKTKGEAQVFARSIEVPESQLDW